LIKFDILGSVRLKKTNACDFLSIESGEYPVTVHHQHF